MARESVKVVVSLLLVFLRPCRGLPTLEWSPHQGGSLLQDDYVTMSYPIDPDVDIVHWSLNSTVPSTGRNYTIHVGSLTAGLPKSFSFELPDGGEGAI